jgi:hypothetical protein
MRSTYLFGVGLLAGFAALTSLGAGCGGGGESGNTGGAGGGTTTTSSSSSSTSTSSSSTSSSTSSSSSSSGSFDNATDLDLSQGNQGDLTDPENGADFYKFDANAGEAWLIQATSLPQGMDNDGSFIDTYIELYDSSKKLIATNDDRYPRSSTDSEIVTVLPSTGTYYVKLQDWCASPAKDAQACTSDYFTKITDAGGTAYGIGAAKLDFTMPGNVQEVEPNDDNTKASPIAFAATTTVGQYYLTVINGKLPMSSDADWYSFKVPSDLAVTAGSRANVGFLFPWGGTTAGNGSNIKVGKVEVVDKSTMLVVAAFDMSGEKENPFDRADLRVPVTKGGDYFLKVTHGGAEADGQGDFYFVYETLGEGNPVEAQEVANNTALTAEVLTKASGTNGSYFVEGNILTPADQDHFKIATGGQPTISVACSSLRAGSGVGGFKVSILKGSDTTTVIPNGTATEDATKNLFIDHVAIPAGETNLIIKLEGASQDTTNTGTQYLCGFHADVAATP